MRRLILAAAFVTILAVPATAWARRPATNAQRSAMLYYSLNGTGYGKPGSPSGLPTSEPARCFSAWISTVPGASNWGAWMFTSRARSCLRYAANGITIDQRVRGRWYSRWAGSSGYPTNVPRRVFRDLYGL